MQTAELLLALVSVAAIGFFIKTAIDCRNRVKLIDRILSELDEESNVE